MRKQVMALMLAVLLVFSVLPVPASAAGTAGTWAVSLNVEKNPEIRYAGQDTIRLGFAVQSDDLKINHAAGIGITVDLNVFDLVYNNEDGTAQSFMDFVSDQVEPYDYYVEKTYSKGKGPMAIKWQADAYIRKDGQKAYILLQPFCSTATDCKSEIVLVTSLLGLKPGKTMDDVNEDSIRWMTAEESAKARQASVIEITDGGANTQNWRFTDTAKADTLKTAPEIRLIGKPKPVMESSGKSLLIENTIQIKYYFRYNGTATDDYVMRNGGLLVWNEKPAAFTPGTESYKVSGLSIYNGSNGKHFYAISQGIPAKNMIDTQYVQAYLKNPDGSVSYSKVVEYSPSIYAEKKLKNPSSTQSLKEFIISMLNYGTAAQEFFGYKTEQPLNSILTPEQRVSAWDASQLIPTKTDSAHKYHLRVDPKVHPKGWSLLLEGAVQMRMYNEIQPELAQNAAQMGIAYWSESTYNSVESLTYENATGIVTGLTQWKDNVYYGEIPGVAAKRLGETYYACAYVTDSDGQMHFGELRTYSAHGYASGKIAKDTTTEPLKDLCKTLVIYSNAANRFFNS